jgi:hypothetical protein
MMIDAFLPAPGKTVTISVGAAATETLLPTGGEFLEYNNSGTTTVFVETGKAPLTAATVAVSYPILAGHCKIVRRDQLSDRISTIGAVAGPVSLFVTAGTGV